MQGIWIVTIDHADDVEALFIPRQTEWSHLTANQSEFGEHGWTAGDFANPAIYKGVYTYVV